MILIIDDDIAVRTSLSLMLEREGWEVVTAASPAEAMDVARRQVPEAALLDMNFSAGTSGREGLLLLRQLLELYPGLPVILITAWASIDLAVEGMKAGAKDFINKPWNHEHLLQSVRTAVVLSGRPEQRLSRRKLDEQYDFGHIIGEDPALLALLETIGRIASTDAPVLILGESGTGKELIAEAIHQNSPRKQKPFIKVNLGGIASSLFESEMFGHVKGAFTDARFDRTGRFELANKGSIFLDEIGELDAGSQVKLLRVLQDRSYEVLGSSRSRQADVRVICATNRNLEDLVAQGLFREDLLYRINLISVRLPALRERSSDIPLLVQFFINNLGQLYNRPHLQVEPAALRWLKQQSFPGNIRQLKNIVERTVLLSAKPELSLEDFQQHLGPATQQPSNKGHLPAVGAMTLEEMEIQMIKKAMEHHQHKVARAARALGLTRSALYRRLDKYQIPYDAAE